MELKLEEIAGKEKNKETRVFDFSFWKLKVP